MHNQRTIGATSQPPVWMNAEETGAFYQRAAKRGYITFPLRADPESAAHAEHLDLSNFRPVRVSHAIAIHEQALAAKRDVIAGDPKRLLQAESVRMIVEDLSQQLRSRQVEVELWVLDHDELGVIGEDQGEDFVWGLRPLGVSAM